MAAKRSVLIAGAGYWGKRVINEYLKLLDSNLLDNIYVFDTDPGNLHFNDNRIISGTEIGEYMGRVDFAHVCTPNVTHFPIAEKLLNSGIATLIEKPLTEVAEEAAILHDMAERNSAVLRVGMVYRYSKAVERAKEILMGSVGATEMIYASWLHNVDIPNIRRVMTGRDVVWDVFIHLLDVLNYLYDVFPDFSYAKGISGANGYNHTFSALGRLVGSTVNMSSTFKSHRKQRMIQIIGEKGNLELDLLNNRISYGNDDDLRTENFYDNPLSSEIKAFIDSKTDSDKRNSGKIGFVEVKLISHLLKMSKQDKIYRDEVQ